MTDRGAIELEYYERFYIERGLEPYPAQERAVGHILNGQSVLVTVPTGTGKTLVAKAGLLKALRNGQRAIYTTPLRALTEEKYREFCEDFGDDQVGFATGDYKVNPEAPIQVLVAEILWNRIYGDRNTAPADVVIMDEGHYFNEAERGYVWEQSIIGLHPQSQLIMLSATIGYAENFCQWVYITRRIPMQLVTSNERRIPLEHEFREDYLIEAVRSLHQAEEVPAIIFAFSRTGCFEIARLLKSCARFTSEDEKKEIQARIADVLLPGGLSKELEPLLLHGIGIHHAGILPRYRRAVEELTLDRLLKFVVSTETISAGINLPAKRVIFPSLRKYVKSKSRLLLPAEYHQMAGRAGRPQFDTEGRAITLAPEEIVQEFRKEIRDSKKKGFTVDEAKIKQKYYNRAKGEARVHNDVTWDREIFEKLVAGQPAALTSRTKITAEQILAIGLPDLAEVSLPGVAYLDETPRPESAEPLEGVAPEVHETGEPAYANLNIRTVIDNLLLPDHEKREAHRRLAMITKNMQALGVLDERGAQIKGDLIGKIRGVDGLFVYFFLMQQDYEYEAYRELVEYLIDHDVVQRQLDRKGEDEKKEWMRNRLRELRRENPLVAWEDVEEEYERLFPRQLTPVELIHQNFTAAMPHPELHGGKKPKNVWTQMEDANQSFEEFVAEHGLEREEGSLFSYLARVMKVARMLREVSGVESFAEIEVNVRRRLAVIDERVLEDR